MPQGKKGAEGANLKLNSDGAAGQQLLNNTLSGCARLYPTHYRCRQQQWDLQKRVHPGVCPSAPLYIMTTKLPNYTKNLFRRLANCDGCNTIPMASSSAGSGSKTPLPHQL
ncbi:hypothetical protein TYRP_004850 [Tyrophagus putrescentiae]|nr:hypothetical protein TYRP_004850 [Tyrophagus putrescentiae]